MASKESILFLKTNLEVKNNKNVIELKLFKKKMYDVRNSEFHTEKHGNLAFVVT